MIIMDCFAALEIALMMVTGIAINNGHGVAITNTARKRIASEVRYQTIHEKTRATNAKTAPI